jgi:heptaprenyl diphosphate synthase
VSVLAAHFGDPATEQVTPAAVVVELTHLATLYHDDVMDEATVRRGARSANSRWGNTVAILTGDFLFSRASSLLADLGPDAVRIQAATFERLVKGQIHETVGPRAGVDPVEHYLSVLADKTGSLIATAALFGASFAGVDPVVTDQLRNFGEHIGVAFQLSDDILDIASDSTESGKTPGTDLREGVATLPVLYALRSDDPAEARLRDLVSRPITDDDEHGEALTLLRASSALADSRVTLAEYAEVARGMLAALPDVPARAALEALTYGMLDRTG